MRHLCTVDSIINYETIKHFGTEQFEMQRLQRLLRRGFRISFSLQMVKDVRSIVANLARGSLILALLLMCAVDIAAGRMTPGTFLVLFNYATTIGARVSWSCSF